MTNDVRLPDDADARVAAAHAAYDAAHAAHATAHQEHGRFSDQVMAARKAKSVAMLEMIHAAQAHREADRVKRKSPHIVGRP